MGFVTCKYNAYAYCRADYSCNKAAENHCKINGIIIVILNCALKIVA